VLLRHVSGKYVSASDFAMGLVCLIFILLFTSSPVRRFLGLSESFTVAARAALDIYAFAPAARATLAIGNAAAKKAAQKKQRQHWRQQQHFARSRLPSCTEPSP